MSRSTLCAMLVTAGVLAASPAFAQFPNIFDSLFGNPPARPPADVPERPPARVPSQPQYVPPQQGNLLPAGPPPGSRIRTEPLPPPPGASVAPPGARLQQPGPPPGQSVNPNAPGTVPGSAPGTAALPPPGQRPAQPAQRGATPPASTVPPPNDELVVEPPPHKIANPTAVFSGLDKITGRIISFDVAINETVRFGALEVTPRACYTRPPTEAPSTDGFVEVDELTLQGELKRIFNGWMFAASPGLNAVEHPIYDVWLTDCKGAPESAPAVAEAPQQPQPAPAPAARAPQRTPPPQRRPAAQLPPPPAPPR